MLFSKSISEHTTTDHCRGMFGRWLTHFDLRDLNSEELHVSTSVPYFSIFHAKDPRIICLYGCYFSIAEVQQCLLDQKTFAHKVWAKWAHMVQNLSVIKSLISTFIAETLVKRSVPKDVSGAKKRKINVKGMFCKLTPPPLTSLYFYKN